MSTILKKIKTYWIDVVIIVLVLYCTIGVSISLYRSNRNTRSIANLSTSIIALSEKISKQNDSVIIQLQSIDAHLNFIDTRLSTNYNWFFADDAKIRIHENKTNNTHNSQSSVFDNKHYK